MRGAVILEGRGPKFFARYARTPLTKILDTPLIWYDTTLILPTFLYQYTSIIISGVNYYNHLPDDSFLVTCREHLWSTHSAISV